MHAERKWLSNVPSVMVMISLLIVTASPTSYAITSATRKTSTIASTTKWSAVMSDATATPTASAYVLSWFPIQGLQNVYTKITNTGSSTLNGFSLFIDSVDSNGNRNNVPKVTVTLCVGATWNSTTDTCSGTMVVLGTLGSGTLSSTSSLASSSSVSVQLSITKTSKVQWITTINTNVSRQQVRAGTLTNS